MQLLLHTIKLPLRHLFRIAHGSTVVQENVLVELRDRNLAGYGEGASVSYYGVTAANMVEDLEAARSQIENWPLGDPADLWQRALPLLGHDRFALAAFDAAAHDLWGKTLGQPTYRLWGLELDRTPASDYTFGIDTIENTLEILKEFDGWPIYKIKLGTTDDLKIVRELRQHTTATFRVDANCAWTAEQTISNSGTEIARSRVHRTAAGDRRLGGYETRLCRIGVAHPGRRELPDRGRRSPLPRVFPWH